MALVGLDRFRERFAAHADRYLLIGGAACHVAMGAAGLPFRATKDLDLVLSLEDEAAAFAVEMWRFIADGGYAVRERSARPRHYYRFARPTDPAFPAMIEIFARRPDGLDLADQQRIVPAIRVVDASLGPVSLSAILLDDAYHGWIRSGRILVTSMPIVRPEHLIPLKAKAWLDLTARKAAGERIDQADITKHRNDIARLYAILDPGYQAPVPPIIHADMDAFITASANAAWDPSPWQVSLGDLLATLRRRYLAG